MRRAALRTTVSCLLLSTGCWELLPASRDPARDALHREPEVCPRGPSRYPPSLFDPRALLSVEPLYLTRSERGVQEQHLIGASIGVLPPPGVTSEELERLLTCHALRRELQRVDEPSVPDDPYALPGHLVHVAVHFESGATHVNVEIRDVAGAQELLRRAKAFMAQAGPGQ